MQKNLRFSSLAVVLLGLVIAGCSQPIPTGTVKGNVTFNGESYIDAAVVFLSMQTGAASSSDIQPDGSYTLPDPLPTGTYNVYLAPKSIPDDVNGEPVPVYADKSVPEKYWSESSTDITAQVNEGENTIPIALSK